VVAVLMSTDLNSAVYLEPKILSFVGPLCSPTILIDWGYMTSYQQDVMAMSKRREEKQKLLHFSHIRLIE
jgi:hypothetical protein